MNLRISAYVLLLVGFLLVLLLSTSHGYDEDDGHTTIGIKRGGRIAKKRLGIKHPVRVEINVLVYDEKTEKHYLIRDLNEVISGQQFMINVLCDQKAYLYILNIDSKNRIYKYFPHPDISLKNPIPSKQNLNFPDDDNLLFEFDKNTGIERFYFFVSSKRVSELDKLIKSIPVNGIALNKEMTDLLVQASSSSDRGSVIAYNKDKKILKQMAGKQLKVNPYMVWFKKRFTKKLVFIHKDSHNEVVDPIMIKTAKKELLHTKNLLQKKDLD